MLVKLWGLKQCISEKIEKLTSEILPAKTWTTYHSETKNCHWEATKSFPSKYRNNCFLFCETHQTIAGWQASSWWCVYPSPQVVHLWDDSVFLLKYVFSLSQVVNLELKMKIFFPKFQLNNIIKWSQYKACFVYFDQQTGAPHVVRWSKSNFWQ